MSHYASEHVCDATLSKYLARIVFPPAACKSEDKEINPMFSSTHKLQRQALQPRTTSVGIFCRRRMPVNSTRACGNARFTCSMHSLYWAFSVVAATSAFLERERQTDRQTDSKYLVFYAQSVITVISGPYTFCRYTISVKKYVHVKNLYIFRYFFKQS